MNHRLATILATTFASALLCAAPLAHSAACSDTRTVPLELLAHTDAYSSVEYPQTGSSASSAVLEAELAVTPEIRRLVLASLQGGCTQSIEWSESAGYDLYLDEYRDASVSYWSASKAVLRFANGSEKALSPEFSMQANTANLSASDRVEFDRVLPLSRSALKKVQAGATLAVVGSGQTRAFIGAPAPWEYATSFVNYVGVPRLVIRLP